SSRPHEVFGMPTPPASVGSATQFIDTLQKSFQFRWEPIVQAAGRPAAIYWPIRLRPPTPIHAVQCFAAAGLQKGGAEVVLYVDDLGTKDCVPEFFLARAEQWFNRAGGTFHDVKVRFFSDAA